MHSYPAHDCTTHALFPKGRSGDCAESSLRQILHHRRHWLCNLWLLATSCILDVSAHFDGSHFNPLAPCTDYSGPHSQYRRLSPQARSLGVYKVSIVEHSNVPGYRHIKATDVSGGSGAGNQAIMRPPEPGTIGVATPTLYTRCTGRPK